MDHFRMNFSHEIPSVDFLGKSEPETKEMFN